MDFTSAPRDPIYFVGSFVWDTVERGWLKLHVYHPMLDCINYGLDTSLMRFFGGVSKWKCINCMIVYNPGERVTVPVFEHYINQWGSGKIIIGDFNAHHQLWPMSGKEY